MNVGLILIANQTKGGVFQYSISFLNSIIQNKKIDKVIVYTNLKEVEIDNVEIIRIKNYKFLFLFGLLIGILNFKINFLFRKPNIIISPTYSPLLFLTSKKFIYTLHDLQEKYFPEYFKKHIILWRKFMYTKLSKKAFRVITESYHVKGDISKYFNIPFEKIEVIESPPIFSKTDENFNLLNHYKELTQPYVFFPAQFWKHKNHLRVISAFSKLLIDHKNLIIVLTGNKIREYSKIKNLIKELNIQENVKFISNIPQNHMPYFFQNARIVIAPTLYESISIPVFEAFYYKVPVCASGVYAIIDQVGDAGELFDPYSVDSIFNSMKKLIESNEISRNDYISKGLKKLNYFSTKRFNILINKCLYGDQIN